MLEMLINPKRAERKPWEMFLIGVLYATISVLLVKILFSPDAVLGKYSGIFLVMFCVIFSMPFVYYTIKLEERKDIIYSGTFRLLKEHSFALWTFLFLFLGFIVAFSILYLVIPNGEMNFKAQIETFCQMNRPDSYEQCLNQYGIVITGMALEKTFLESNQFTRLKNILVNNIWVLIFTLIFSVIFGAGAIFILAWNASVIAAAIGIFARSSLVELPIGIARYMIHGLPEIAAYFIAALGGGILSIAFIKRDIKSDKFWLVVQDSLNLILLAIAVLIIAALIEVFITPALF